MKAALELHHLGDWKDASFMSSDVIPEIKKIKKIKKKYGVK